MRAVGDHPPPPRRLDRRRARADGRRPPGRRDARLRRGGGAQARARGGGGHRARRGAHGPDADLCIVLGGDGTILTALREYAGSDVPVFAINFGEVGFLATLDPDGLGRDFDRAFSGDFERLQLPTIDVGRPEGVWTAINDISVHRKPGMRVADLAYGLTGEEIGRVRCDGLVVATPAGLDGLQPRQRRPRAGVGRARLRRLLHRAALAHRPRARGRPGRPADDQQREPRGARRGPRRRAPGVRAAGGGGHPRRVRQLLRDARPAAGRDASTTACASASGGWRSSASAVPRTTCTETAPRIATNCAQPAGPSQPAGTPSTDAPRAARREPAADRARRAAPRPGAERPDRGDRRGQDRARPRARPAAGRQAAARDRAPRGGRGLRRGRLRAARTTCGPSSASAWRRTPTRSCSPAA